MGKTIKETDYTLEQIETILVGMPYSPYYIRQNIVVPNVAWGFLNHEADLLILNKTNRLIEIEIKRTWADFMADFRKSHTHNDEKLSYFYYAVPESIGEKVFYWLYEGEYEAKHYWDRSKVNGYTEHNSNKCGLIVYGENIFHNYCLTVPAGKMGDHKLSVEEELKLLRLGNMRIWGMKKKLAEYQVETNLFKV